MVDYMYLKARRWTLPVLAGMMRMFEGPMKALTRPVGLAAFLSLVLVLPAPAAGAKDAPPRDTKVVVDPYPLRPPDTSSPRDTLRSFLTNADIAIKAWRQDAIDKIADHAWMSAIMTLDFSTTPESDSWSVRTERLLLLKEILDRIKLPPDDKIPGKEEAAKGGVTRWTLPNTRITIARIESGPQAGEFLFSAATVERLSGYYMIARELPYKPTASSPGIYEAYTSSNRTQLALESQLRMRLQRVDTSSPRSTLKTFLDNVNQAWVLVKKVDIALKADPPTMTTQQALEIDKTVDGLLRRAAATLDLRQVHLTFYVAVGPDIAHLATEITAPGDIKMTIEWILEQPGVDDSLCDSRYSHSLRIPIGVVVFHGSGGNAPVPSKKKETVRSAPSSCDTL